MKISVFFSFLNIWKKLTKNSKITGIFTQQQFSTKSNLNFVVIQKGRHEVSTQRLNNHFLDEK